MNQTNVESLRRGFEEIIPGDAFEERLAEPARVKFGIDPTGDELHLGHAVILNKLRQFQDQGHTVVLIVGDFTARIGDPSGRDETRPTLTQEEIRSHARTYHEQSLMVLDDDRTELRYNSEWLDDLGAEGMLRLASRLTVARMLERDDFARRFEAEQPIRLHEFLYPLLQARDSVEVEADVELGGTDQKFNLLVGRRLQREEGQKPQVIGTLPILPGTDGTEKMSKSLDNHIPLAASGREMFGQLMSIPDEAILPYARLLTDPATFPLDELERELQTDASNPKSLKKRVAHAVTRRYRGEDAAKEARDYFERTVEKDEDPRDEEMDVVRVHPRADVEEMEVDSGSAEISVKVPEDDIWIVDLLDAARVVESRGEARRLLEQGGVYLDGERLEGFDHDVPLDRERILRVGKHRFRRVVPRAGDEGE